MQDYFCAVRRTTISFTSTSGGCSIANAIAGAIASGDIAKRSRDLLLAGEHGRDVGCRPLAGRESPSGDGRGALAGRLSAMQPVFERDLARLLSVLIEGLR